MPCERPIIGVNLCSFARTAMAARSFAQVGQQQIGARDQLQRQRRVEQVGRRQPAMDEPARPADVRRDFLQKRDHVVVRPLLVFPHLLDVERRLRADDLRVLGRE
jgi:hypothetical protein